MPGWPGEEPVGLAQEEGGEACFSLSPSLLPEPDLEKGQLQVQRLHTLARGSRVCVSLPSSGLSDTTFAA